MYRFYQSLLLALTVWAATGCQKELDVQKMAPVTTAKAMFIALELKTSSSRAELHAGNAKNTAVCFTWPSFTGSAPNQTYTIEADLAGSQFSTPIEIGSTNKQSLGFTVAELNSYLRKISVAESLTRFEFRVRMNCGDAAPLYSQGAAIDISTYDLWKDFPALSTFRVPGNYGNWDFNTAPLAVSPQDDGEYEAYIDMNITGMQVSNPMFFLVKGYPTLTEGNMFFDIGSGKFGPGKYVFQAPVSGIYKLNFSTNTNKWNCAYISGFSIYGSAAGNADVQMEYSNATKTWSLTTNLDAGDFYFRANRANRIRLGTNNKDLPGALQADGDNIRISTPGKYKLTLSVLSAGNYRYGLQRIF